MKIPTETIDRVASSLYEPSFKFLKEADAKYPIANGVFQIGKTYSLEQLEHLTDIEAQFCLNQLLYVAFAEWLQKGDIEKVQIPFEEYLKLMKENMFIVESHKKFDRPISTRNPISGTISVRKLREHKGLYVANIEWEFEDKKAEGELTLAMKLR